MSKYVLITPAHNEETFIGKTIESVLHQKVLPERWVIVSDASTDRTVAIVESYQRLHAFISLVQITRTPGRHFGNKVAAFNRGLATLDSTPYDFIGNLDADLSFPPDYFENILNELKKDDALGIAGGLVSSLINGKFEDQNVAQDSVAGAVQMFRRKCFEQNGGYIALPNGGIDAAAEIGARMHGWKTRTFAEYRVLEHRMTGTANASPLQACIREGKRFYSLGYDPVFYFLRCIYRFWRPPFLLGGIAAPWGYIASWIKREPVVLPSAAVSFLRKEQRHKLMALIHLKDKL